MCRETQPNVQLDYLVHYGPRRRQRGRHHRHPAPSQVDRSVKPHVQWSPILRDFVGRFVSSESWPGNCEQYHAV